MNLNEVFNKVVFLLGAGASKEAGCKLSNEMLTSLKEEINNLTASEKDFINYKEDFDEIYHFILASLKYQSTMKDSSVSSSDYVNIEDFVMVLRQLIDKEFIIPYPLIGNWNDKILKWEIKNGNVFEHFKDFVRMQLVKDWTRFNKEKAEEILQPIREMLNNSESIKVNFFSLNYDLIFEQVFNTSIVKILDNGFSEKNISENQMRYWAADFNNELSPTKINLYKLHGSIDWEYNLDSEEISIKESIDDGREPLIIFGSYSKMLSFDPFLYILSNFRQKLEEATIFVVIGYSFHDKYINNLLIQQLSQNTDEDKQKKLLVVNPTRPPQTARAFTEELKSIQDSKSINDIINFRQVSPERIKLISKTASQFYAEYFANGATLLKKELEEIEGEEKLFQ
ncbi:MAG: SIR2 family protein [Ignavibacteria bacterium]|nr:SIR2 family protein [Ignavibacteria bacterium]